MKKILTAFATACLLFVGFCSCDKNQGTTPVVKGEFSEISGAEDRTVAAQSVDPINVHFTSTAFWRATAPSWIHPSKDYGLAGTYDVTLTVDANPETSPRSGEVQFSCGDDVRTFTIQQNAKVIEPTVETKSFSFRLMSFNILQSTGEAEGHTWSEYREKPCKEMFEATQPDIICLQECRRTQLNFMKSNFPQYSYFQYAKDGVKKAGYENVEKCDDDGIFQNGGHRDVIALRTNRFTMLDWGRYWFSDTPDVSSYSGPLFEDGGTPKLTLWLKVRERETGIVFYVWTTHFFPNGVNGRKQCGIMSVERMKAECAEDTPVFFCGDLNLAYEHESLLPLRLWMQHAATKAEKADKFPTYTGFRTNQATWTYIDHIFYRNAVASTYKVVNTPIENGTSVCSDHFPIYADFTVTVE